MLVYSWVANPETLELYVWAPGNGLNSKSQSQLIIAELPWLEISPSKIVAFPISKQTIESTLKSALGPSKTLIYFTIVS